MGGFCTRARCGTAGLAMVWAIGCSGGMETNGEGGARMSSPSPGGSPTEALAAIEAQLLRVEGGRIEFDVRSEGAFEASLEGVLTLGQANALALDASGVFGPNSVSLWLDATDASMSWGNQTTEAELARPDGLREAVVIGFVRMGVLHNLARLTGGAPPDHMDGDVRAWVQAVDPQWTTGDPEVGTHGISFELEVDGRRSGTATVWLGSDGTVVGRDQLVQFTTGEMRVTERYDHRPD
jgi:hypothetical protein